MENNQGLARSDTLRKIVSPRNINRIIPVISNSFHLERIFRDEKKITEQIVRTSEHLDEDFTVDEQLTKIWAQEIKYPLTDSHNMARVAQYHQVEHGGSEVVAKEQYLEFLKSYLLDLNANEPKYKDTVADLRKQLGHRLFSDIVEELEYPRISQGEDSVALLAELPFQTYITTSHYDFLERALKKNNKTPRTQVIFWEEGAVYADPSHAPDPLYVPNSQSPAVYHIFGMENYPETLVLSEDDYLRFLISVVSVTDTQNPIIPLMLKRALANSHLLLLGYHLRDWEFRVFFRFILQSRSGESKDGIFIQLKPKQENEHLVDYLHHFFNKKKFGIEWKSSDDFIREFWQVIKDQQS